MPPGKRPAPASRPAPGSRDLGPIVHGDGVVPCRAMFIGEMPGVEELASGIPFAPRGRAGRELWRYALAGVIPDRDELYVTNVLKQRPRGKSPDAEELAYWRRELDDEIAFVDPEVIVALGATAARVFIPDAVLERVHGLAFQIAADRIVVPTYNPAAALHSPEVQSLFAWDMEVVGRGLKRGFRIRPTDTVTTDYRELPFDLIIPDQFSIDTEGWPDEPWCLTISWKPGTGYLVPAGDRERLARIRRALRLATRVTCQGMLADLDVLAAMDLHVPDAAIDDTQIMAYLLNIEPQGLKDLAYRHLGADQEDYTDLTREAEDDMVRGYITVLAKSHHNPRVVKACERILKKLALPNALPARVLWRNSKFHRAVPPPPRVTLDLVKPQRRAVVYACRDADLTERLRPVLRRLVKERDLDRVYKLDLQVIPIVNRMQHVGMRIVPEHFTKLIEQFDREFLATLTAIEKAVGQPVNPNSGPQVAALLFDTLHLPTATIRRTKSRDRFSTQDKYLEALRSAHPVVPLIIDGRELTKLKSAYAAAILNAMIEGDDGGWYLYPHLRITRVVSGRVSAFDPNVLAIPKHSARGKLIRLGFIAGENRTLLSVDLSQIELRIAAHECRDPGMVKVFLDGKDLHAALGERIFGIKAELQDESKHRLPMKKANFGYWMGISAAGMRDQLHAAGATSWTEDDCARIMRDMDRVWPGASEYKDEKIRQARRFGYVTDFLGRRRYLAGVHSPDNQIRSEAERQAHATPIQSGAQEVFKTWMAAIWKTVIVPARTDPSTYCEPWLQVHDDFLSCVHAAHRERYQTAIMNCIPQLLRVPVSAKAKAAATWGEL